MYHFPCLEAWDRGHRLAGRFSQLVGILKGNIGIVKIGTQTWLWVINIDTPQTESDFHSQCMSGSILIHFTNFILCLFVVVALSWMPYLWGYTCVTLKEVEHDARKWFQCYDHSLFWANQSFFLYWTSLMDALILYTHFTQSFFLTIGKNLRSNNAISIQMSI